jgi:hypothetical protein
VAEVWASLKTRFVGADRVNTVRLATLKGEFDKLYMEDREALDDYAGKISSMATCYVGLGATLDNAAMVKKLLDTVPLGGTLVELLQSAERILEHHRLDVAELLDARDGGEEPIWYGVEELFHHGCVVERRAKPDVTRRHVANFMPKILRYCLESEAMAMLPHSVGGVRSPW